MPQTIVLTADQIELQQLCSRARTSARTGLSPETIAKLQTVSQALATNKSAVTGHAVYIISELLQHDPTSNPADALKVIQTLDVMISSGVTLERDWKEMITGRLSAAAGGEGLGREPNVAVRAEALRTKCALS